MSAATKMMLYAGATVMLIAVGAYAISQLGLAVLGLHEIAQENAVQVHNQAYTEIQNGKIETAIENQKEKDGSN
jgi:hypothetical protein